MRSNSARIGTSANVAKLTAEIHAACSGRARLVCFDAELVAQVCREVVVRRQLLRDLHRELAIEAALVIDARELLELGLRRRGELCRLFRDVGGSASCCELTETNSPTAIDIAPAVSPATPATSTARADASAAATPIISDDVETIASFEPSTAARSQLLRIER